MELLLRSQYRDYPQDNHRLILRENYLFYIGRTSESDLQLPSDTIGRRHCSIELEGDTIFLRDLSSTNGTQLNGVYIDRAEFTLGDRCRLGDHLLTYVSSLEESTPTDEELLSSQRSSDAELLASLARKHWDLAAGVAQNIHAPSAMLAWLAESRRAFLRALVAKNPSTDPKTLLSLMSDCASEIIENPVFSLILWENPGALSSLGWYTLEKLKEHKDPKVRELVSRLL
jgi:pSer/pThr/pTyr-binding forkhead associated (FHA) protein